MTNLYTDYPLYLMTNALKWAKNNDKINVEKLQAIAAFIFENYLKSNYEIQFSNVIALTICNSGQIKNDDLDKLATTTKTDEFAQFIKKTKEKLTNFDQLYSQFEREVLICSEVAFATLQRIIQTGVTFDSEFLYTRNSKTPIHIEGLLTITQTLAREIKEGDDFGEEIPVETGSLICVYKHKERRCSIIMQTKDEACFKLGEGAIARVYSMYSLTRTKRVAVKIFRTKGDEKFFQSFKNFLLKEISILEKFNALTKNYSKILPGLPFFPVQEFLHKYKDRGGNPVMVSIQYKKDLFDWITKSKPLIMPRLFVFFQILWMGCFQDKIGYLDLDKKLDNIFVANDDPVIAFGDLNGDFEDELTTENCLKILKNRDLFPEEDDKILKNAKDIKENINVRKQISAYQIGCLLFACIVGYYPHVSREPQISSRPVFPSNADIVEENRLQEFRLAFKTLPISNVTMKGLEQLVLSMIVKDTMKRVNCIDGYNSLLKIIEKDPFLFRCFKNMKYLQDVK